MLTNQYNPVSHVAGSGTGEAGRSGSGVTYGRPTGLADEEILERLLALNLERAG